LASRAPTVPPARSNNSRQTTDPVRLAKEKADADSFAAFEKWYNDSVGKSVTVVVQEANQTNSFSFTVR
jgi:hypothetical protein